MSLAAAALRREIEDAKADLARGGGPRNVFEAVVYDEARDQLRPPPAQEGIFGSPPAVEKAAAISPCGRYRYSLTRRWEPRACSLPIIMLNPSTADAEVDDPTIRRCMGFARREGFGGIIVANLFAFRATCPDDMKAADDPYGPGGSAAIEGILGQAALANTPVLAAWGAHGGHLNRDNSVGLSAQGHGARLVCLGRTAAGHPRHPLYVRGDQPFEDFA